MKRFLGFWKRIIMKSQRKPDKGCFCGIIISVILLVGLPLEIGASVVTFEFSGTITSVNYSAPDFPSALAGIQPGDSMTGSYSYESSTSASANPFANSGNSYSNATYYEIPNTFSLKINNVSIPIGGSTLSTFVWNNNSPAGSTYDALIILTSIYSTQSYRLNFGNLVFANNTFGNDSLPSASIMEPVVLELWGGSMTTYLHGEASTLVVNNAVPIPAAVWLLGSGLIGLIGIRRFGK